MARGMYSFPSSFANLARDPPDRLHTKHVQCALGFVSIYSPRHRSLQDEHRRILAMKSSTIGYIISARPALILTIPCKTVQITQPTSSPLPVHLIIRIIIQQLQGAPEPVIRKRFPTRVQTANMSRFCSAHALLQ